MTAAVFDGEGLITRRVSVSCADVAWVRYVVEAHEGLASLHIERGGLLTLVAPACRERELDAVLDDIASEIELVRGVRARPVPAEGGPRSS